MKKEEIKAVIFDIGGVVYYEPADLHSVRLAKLFNINLERLKKARKKFSYDATIGKISANNYPKLVAQEIGLKNQNLFLKKWYSERRKLLILDKRVKKTLFKLKRKYLIGALTNITKTNDKVRLEKKVYKGLNFKIISNKVGIKKPDIKIYKLLIKKLNLNPQEIIFIDDELEYLLPAKKLGIKTILFKNNRQLIKDLKKLGVKL